MWQSIAKEILGEHEHIRLIPPMEVVEFHNLLANSYLILTDSGGIQEEAPSLHKPVLVLRDTTERPEALDAGTVKLVGTNYNVIDQQVSELLAKGELYHEMNKAVNPYGDGKSAPRIVEIVESVLCK